MALAAAVDAWRLYGADRTAQEGDGESHHADCNCGDAAGRVLGELKSGTSRATKVLMRFEYGSTEFAVLSSVRSERTMDIVPATKEGNTGGKLNG